MTGLTLYGCRLLWVRIFLDVLVAVAAVQAAMHTGMDSVTIASDVETVRVLPCLIDVSLWAVGLSMQRGSRSDHQHGQGQHNIDPPHDDAKLPSTTTVWANHCHNLTFTNLLRALVEPGTASHK